MFKPLKPQNVALLGFDPVPVCLIRLRGSTAPKDLRARKTNTAIHFLEPKTTGGTIKHQTWERRRDKATKPDKQTKQNPKKINEAKRKQTKEPASQRLLTLASPMHQVGTWHFSRVDGGVERCSGSLAVQALHQVFFCELLMMLYLNSQLTQGPSLGFFRDVHLLGCLWLFKQIGYSRRRGKTGLLAKHPVVGTNVPTNCDFGVQYWATLVDQYMFW